MGPQQAHDGVAVVAVNGVLQKASHSVRVDSLFQLGPVCEPIFARDDELGIVQEKLCCGNCSLIRFVKPGVTALNSIERVGQLRTPIL